MLQCFIAVCTSDRSLGYHNTLPPPILPFLPPRTILPREDRYLLPSGLREGTTNCHASNKMPLFWVVGSDASDDVPQLQLKVHFLGYRQACLLKSEIASGLLALCGISMLETNTMQERGSKTKAVLLRHIHYSLIAITTRKATLTALVILLRLYPLPLGALLFVIEAWEVSWR